MRKRSKILLAMLLLTKLAAAQQLSPQTVNAAGKSHSNGGIFLEDALGGLLVSTIATPTFMYTQDFLQPDAGSTNIIPPINDVVLSSGSGVDNAGTTLLNNNIMLEFTIGEFASITQLNGNNMLTQGILQPHSLGVVLPVTGFDLGARRTDAQTVSLNWKTVQEFSNKGFHIERKYENENSFSTIGYMATAALDGNSSLPLFYQKNDNNSFTGKTYYRIRQEDIDGSSTYSPVRMVDGIATTASMKVWPIPSAGPVNVVVNGITKADQLLLFDMNGKMVQKKVVQNGLSIKLTNLGAGTYIIKLAGNNDLVQKIVVQ